jgi:hypothetical protein
LRTATAIATAATGVAHHKASTSRRPVRSRDAIPAATHATHTPPAASSRLGRTPRARAASAPDASAVRRPPRPNASSAPSHSAAAGRSLIVCIAANSTGGLLATRTAALNATAGGASRLANRNVPQTSAIVRRGVQMYRPGSPAIAAPIAISHGNPGA